jgi:hypothetical protein
MCDYMSARFISITALEICRKLGIGSLHLNIFLVNLIVATD